MIVYKIQVNQLYEGQHCPLDFNCGAFGDGGILEWHKNLDLKLAQFNNIKVVDKNAEKRDVVECFLFMAKLPKKEYKKYRKEYDKEGYSEIAEDFINYDWTIVTSKKFKF